jgi:hypothetical protein
MLQNISPRTLRRLQMLRRDKPQLVGLFSRLDQASPRSAIKAQCIECQRFEIQGVKECRDTACPLFLHRPYRERVQRPTCAVGNKSDNK